MRAFTITPDRWQLCLDVLARVVQHCTDEYDDTDFDLYAIYCDHLKNLGITHAKR